MARTLLSSLLLLPLSALAQPTLPASNIPVAGQSFTYVEATYQDVSNTGINQTWDVSNAFTTGGGVQSWVAPAGATGGANFPTATIAVSTTPQIEFVQNTAAGTFVIGSYVNANGIISTCSNSTKTMQFPCTYGTTWTDASQCSYTYMSTTYVTNGTLDAEADGYGTLVLPYGSFTNVLRISLSQISTTLVGGDEHGISVDNTYFWRPGTPTYVAYNGVVEQTLNGNVLASDQEINYLAQSSSGIEDALLQDVGIELAPNPASSSVAITFGAQGELWCEVVDVQGRTVRQVNLGMRPPGIHRYEMDLGGLNKGLYNVVLANAQGERGVQRLVIE